MNRRERRRIEKNFGLIKQYQKGTKEERADIKEKRREAGKKLMNHVKEQRENDRRKQMEEIEARTIQGLVANGHTEKQAREIWNTNLEIDKKRKAKKLAKQNN